MDNHFPIQCRVLINFVCLFTVYFISLLLFKILPITPSPIYLISFKTIFTLIIVIVSFQYGIFNKQLFTSNAFIVILLALCVIYTVFQEIKLNDKAISTNEHYIFILTCLSTGFIEEFLFRGFFFIGIYKYFYGSNTAKLHRSIFISSLIFAFAHSGTIFFKSEVNLNVVTQIILAFFCGYFLCSLLIYTKNIILISLIHAIINYFGSLNTVTSQSRQIATTSMSMEQFTISTLILLSVCLLVVLPIYYFLTEDKSDWQRMIHHPKVL